LLVNSFGLIVIFINVFSRITLSFMQALFWPDDEVNEHWGVNRTTYALGMAIALLPTTFMKEIAELHLVSLSLFTAALLFVVINILQLMIRGNQWENTDLHYNGYF